jgi:hypothetical protein
MEKFKIEELLKCELTNDELIVKGNELSKKNQEISRLENNKKAITSEYSAKINAAVAEIETLSLAISSRSEDRQVKCEIKYNNPVEGQKTIIRCDTSAIVRIIMMDDEEKQDLFINALGEQGEEFIFRDKRKIAIIEQKDCSQADAAEWESLGFPQTAEALVEAPLEKSQTYRVVKGEDTKTEKMLYQLQKMIAKGKKAKKGKKKKDTMAVKRTLTSSGWAPCEDSDMTGCCQCEKENCKFRHLKFGEASVCGKEEACSAECPRLVK